jgi:hypothetical protein
MKNIAQTLFASAAVGSVIAFILGATHFDRYDTWPGAMLMGISIIILLGAGIAVKHLYFRDE